MFYSWTWYPDNRGKEEKFPAPSPGKAASRGLFFWVARRRTWQSTQARITPCNHPPRATSHPPAPSVSATCHSQKQALQNTFCGNQLPQPHTGGEGGRRFAKPAASFLQLASSTEPEVLPMQSSRPSSAESSITRVSQPPPFHIHSFLSSAHLMQNQTLVRNEGVRGPHPNRPIFYFAPDGRKPDPRSR